MPIPDPTIHRPDPAAEYYFVEGCHILHRQPL